MNCKSIKEQISAYLDEELQNTEMKEVATHLGACSDCREHAESVKHAWNLLEDVEDIEPDSGYVSRFWTELSLRTPWYEALIKGIKEGVRSRKLVPVYVSVLGMLVAGVFIFRLYVGGGAEHQYLAALSVEEIEMVENIELAEYLDIIGDLEFFEDFEIIENLDVNGSQQT